MKKKIVHYTIADPCHESWNAMTPIEQGRFCNNCATPVVDFTSMTDFDVMQYMSAAKGSVCGRMTDNQLNRDFTQYEMEQTRSFSMRALVLGAALSTFSALTSCAQNTTIKNEEHKPVEQHHKVGKVAPTTKKPPLPDSVLSGYVKDKNYNEVDGVKVTLYDENAKELTSTLANEHGEYKLTLDPADKPAVVVFNKSGYLEKSFLYSEMVGRMEVVVLSSEMEEIKMGTIGIEEKPEDSRKHK